MSVANQKIIYGSVLAPTDKQNLYSLRNIEAERAAMRDLNYSGFKMWVYFSENQADYKFELSREACNKIGINKNSYYSGIKELEEKGYLVKASGNGYIFHQEKILTVLSEKQTNMITNTEQNLSEKQTPDSEKQTELSEKQTLMSDFQQRNNTNNTDTTKDNTILAAEPQKITLKEAKALEAAATVNCRIDWANGVLRFSNGATYQLEG